MLQLDRLRRRHYRSLMMQAGMTFCDEPTKIEDVLGKEHLKLDLWELMDQNYNVIEGALEASSCDDYATQDIGQTLVVGRPATFWSSTGSATPEAEDTLTYRLKHPLCVVHAVALTVYRAFYQRGEPLFPPQKLSVQVGPALTLLQHTGTFSVAKHDLPQVFPLPPDAPVGGYLRLTLHNRCQLQQQDMQYYVAVMRVQAVGHAVTQTLVPRLLRGLQTKQVDVAGACCCLPANAVEDLRSGTRLSSGSLASTSSEPGPWYERLQNGFRGSEEPEDAVHYVRNSPRRIAAEGLEHKGMGGGYKGESMLPAHLFSVMPANAGAWHSNVEMDSTSEEDLGDEGS